MRGRVREGRSERILPLFVKCVTLVSGWQPRRAQKSVAPGCALLAALSQHRGWRAQAEGANRRVMGGGPEARRRSERGLARLELKPSAYRDDTSIVVHNVVLEPGFEVLECLGGDNTAQGREIRSAE